MTQVGCTLPYLVVYMSCVHECDMHSGPMQTDRDRKFGSCIPLTISKIRPLSQCKPIDLKFGSCILQTTSKKHYFRKNDSKTDGIKNKSTMTHGFSVHLLVCLVHFSGFIRIATPKTETLLRLENWPIHSTLYYKNFFIRTQKIGFAKKLRTSLR